jgi:8-oxo-dGTP diphosphatase
MVFSSIKHYSAIAILHRDDRFLLQLRENRRDRLYSDCWGIIGGHIEPGESPEVALRRELREEIDYSIASLAPFKIFSTPDIFCYMYSGELTVDLHELTLGEGRDIALFTQQEIQAGYRFSKQAQQVHPIGENYRKVLLDFIQHQNLLKPAVVYS